MQGEQPHSGLGRTHLDCTRQLGPMQTAVPPLLEGTLWGVVGGHLLGWRSLVCRVGVEVYREAVKQETSAPSWQIVEGTERKSTCWKHVVPGNLFQSANFRAVGVLNEA